MHLRRTVYPVAIAYPGLPVLPLEISFSFRADEFGYSFPDGGHEVYKTELKIKLVYTKFLMARGPNRPPHPPGASLVRPPDGAGDWPSLLCEPPLRFFPLDGTFLRLVGLLSEPIVESLGPGPMFLSDSRAAPGAPNF